MTMAATQIDDPLLSDWSGLEGRELIKAVLDSDHCGRVLVTTSFGAESAVLLDMVAQVERATPVLFVDTGRLFPETLVYRDHLVAHLGLSDVRTVSPSQALVANEDPDGRLFESDPDACCHVRKVMPYALAVSDFDILISGRKRHHGDARRGLQTVERAGHHIKVNPLAHLTSADIEAAFEMRKLPRHPLGGEGYTSIGCAPCTHKACPAKGVRAGRWAGRDKSECGIHTYTHTDF